MPEFKACGFMPHALRQPRTLLKTELNPQPYTRKTLIKAESQALTSQILTLLSLAIAMLIVEVVYFFTEGEWHQDSWAAGFLFTPMTCLLF